MDEPKLTTVLIIEDNEADAELLFRSLGTLRPRFRLERVSSGEAAIDYFEGNAGYADRQQFPFPSLVLLDMHLPFTSGSDVLLWIKKQPDLGPTLVMILSGASQHHTGKSMETHGNVTISYSVFLKPIGREIVATILDLFEHWLSISETKRNYSRSANVVH